MLYARDVRMMINATLQQRAGVVVVVVRAIDSIEYLYLWILVASLSRSLSDGRTTERVVTLADDIRIMLAAFTVGD